MSNLFAALVPLCFAVGCQAPVERGKLQWQRAIHDTPAMVTCYSGGEVVLEGVTTGRPWNENNTGAYFFSLQDGRMVEAFADCLFEYQNR